MSASSDTVRGALDPPPPPTTTSLPASPANSRRDDDNDGCTTTMNLPPSMRPTLFVYIHYRDFLRTTRNDYLVASFLLEGFFFFLYMYSLFFATHKHVSAVASFANGVLNATVERCGVFRVDGGSSDPAATLSSSTYGYRVRRVRRDSGYDG